MKKYQNQKQRCDRVVHTCESEKVKVKEEGMFFIQMVLNQLNRRNKVYTMYIHTCTQGCHCKLLTGSHWPPDVWKVCGRLLPGLVLVPSEYYSVAVYVLDQCCSRVLHDRVCTRTRYYIHEAYTSGTYTVDRDSSVVCVVCCVLHVQHIHSSCIQIQTQNFFTFTFTGTGCTVVLYTR